MPSLPRIALVLPEDDRRARVAAQAVRELTGAPTVDVVTVGRPGAGPTHDGGRGLAEALLAARDAGQVVALTGASGVAGARAAWAAGAIDGWVSLEPGLRAPRLRLRAGCAVLEPVPVGPAATLAERLRGVDLAGPAAAAARLLKALRCPGALIVFAVPGVGEVATACATIGPAAAWVGPLSAATAATAGGAAFVAWTPDQADLPLALAGEGPETVFALEEEPWAWPAEPDAAGAVLTVARLASAQAALGSLAADREAASAPRVTVASAPRRQEDRCPFCWRALDAAPADDGPGPGPPLRCAGCGTAHHRDCLGDHRACTVLGCDSPTAVRLGVELPIEGLGCEAPRLTSFTSLGGDAGLGPRWLRVEAPIDDPRQPPTRTRLTLELGASRVRRGSTVAGFVAIATPRPLRVSGGALRLRASLSTAPRAGERGAASEQVVVFREAPFLGEGPASALGRLGASLFAAGRLTTIPPGVRRYPFSFLLDPDHPATLENVRAERAERLQTVLEVALDTLDAKRTLDVAP